jgi:hypothetical protein
MEAPMANAPVCPISRDQPLPGMPGTMLSAVPKAVDLPSAIAAANALGTIVTMLVNPPTVNNLALPGPGGIPWMPNYVFRNKTINGPSGKGAGPPSRWVENERNTQAVDIVGKIDPTSRISVDRIFFEEWRDHNNNGIIDWRPHPDD